MKMGKMASFCTKTVIHLGNAGYIQGRVILQFRDEKVRVVFKGGLYSRAGSVTGFTVYKSTYFSL